MRERFEGPLQDVPDAHIRVVPMLPEVLPGAVFTDEQVQAREGALLLSVPGVARYLIEGGTRIDVAPAPDADEGAVAVHLFGTARAALIHQRGELPLHAAVLVAPGAAAAVAICGPSGAGKSTLAAELARRGWLLVAEDAVRITMDQGGAIAWPGRDVVRLWRDSCERLDIAVDGLEPIYGGSDKYCVPVTAFDRPVRLAAIIELVRGEQLALGEAAGGDKLALIVRHVFRWGHVRPLGRLERHVRIVSQVAGACRTFQLGGARTHAPAELARMIEQVSSQAAGG